jgi:hypothetical protein
MWYPKEVYVINFHLSLRQENFWLIFLKINCIYYEFLCNKLDYLKIVISTTKIYNFETL